MEERQYAISTLIGDFLGLPWRYELSGGDGISIALEGQNNAIRMPDVFFRLASSSWLNPDSMPLQPLRSWDTRELVEDIELIDPVVPVIFGDLSQRECETYVGLDLPIDIFGSAFFMLSRYEEVVRPDRDVHDRFPSSASIAFQEGFLERPIIDEYLEILWRAMKKLWPQLERKKTEGVLRVTCDLDSPYQIDFSSYAMARGVAADLLKRRSPRRAFVNLQTRYRARRGDFSGDPYLDDVDWMMEVNEEAGNRVAFYLIADGHDAFDARYRLEEPVIRRLMRRIHERGHEIGLHPSYASYRSAEQLQREAGILRSILENLDIPHQELGGRQHYLRWQTPLTARNCEAASMRYDSTLSYADRSGFRCGTGREFTMYDVGGRRSMRLKQRPLVLMETSVISDSYMGMGYSEQAGEYMQMLQSRSMRLGGECTLLWHNSSFENDTARKIYQALIRA